MNHHLLLIFEITTSIAILISCSSDKKQDQDPEPIIKLTPDNGAANRLIAIESSNAFGSSANDNIVKINGTVAEIISASKSRIIAKVPSQGSTGALTIETGSKILSGPVFTYVIETAQSYFVKLKLNDTKVIDMSFNILECESNEESQCIYGPLTGHFIYVGTTDLSPDSQMTLTIVLPLNELSSDIESLINNTWPIGRMASQAQFKFAFGHNSNLESTSYEPVPNPDPTDVAIVNKVTYVGSTDAGRDKYSVEGTFQCKLLRDDFSGLYAQATDGSFKLEMWAQKIK